MKKKLLIIICSIVLFAIIVGGTLFAWNRLGPGNNINRVITALAAQNHEEAMHVFDENRMSIDMYALSNALSNRLTALQGEFLAESISFTVSMAEINILINWQIAGLDEQINEASRFIETLNYSRTAFEQAQTQFANGNYVEAIHNFQRVSNEDPNFNLSREGITSAMEAFSSVTLMEAATHSADGDFIHAMLIISSAIDAIGNDANLVSQYEIYRRSEISSRIDEAHYQAQRDNFVEAIYILRLVDSQNPNDTGIQQALAVTEYDHTNFIVNEVSSLVSSQRFDDAVHKIDEGLGMHPDNISLTSLRSSIEFEHVSFIIDMVAEYSESYEFETAISMLENGLNFYPNNVTITDALINTREIEINLLMAQADEYVSTMGITAAIVFLQNSRLYLDNSVIARINELIPERQYLESDIFSATHSADWQRHPEHGTFTVFGGETFHRGISTTIPDSYSYATFDITGRDFTRLAGTLGITSLGRTGVQGVVPFSGDASITVTDADSGRLLGGVSISSLSNETILLDVQIPPETQRILIRIDNRNSRVGLGDVFFEWVQ